MASTTVDLAIQIAGMELRVNSADFEQLLTAKVQSEVDGKLTELSIIPDPDVPQGTVRGVGLASFKVNDKIIERLITVSYTKKISEL